MGLLAEIFDEPLASAGLLADLVLPAETPEATAERLVALASLLETEHAPAGGVTLGGKHFVGGEFIPAAALAKASPAELKKLKAAKTAGDTKEPVAKAGGTKKPAAKAGGSEEPTETGYQPSVTITPTQRRAFEGEPAVIKTKLSKQAAGKIGEDIIIAHLQSLGMDDARPMNLDRNNFPIDLIQDHEVIEGKTGNAGNGKGAQQWRLTIGEPGKAEKAWLATASDEDKAKWNAEKQRKIHERKEAVIRELGKKLGHPVKTATMTVILNPDTKTADIYKFDGFHDRIGWNSELAKKAYVRSVTYE